MANPPLNFTPKSYHNLQTAGRSFVAVLAFCTFILLIVGNIAVQARIRTVSSTDPFTTGTVTSSFYLYKKDTVNSWDYQNVVHMSAAHAMAVIATIMAVGTTSLAIAFAILRPAVHKKACERESSVNHGFSVGETIIRGDMGEGVTPYQQVAHDQSTTSSNLKGTKERYYYDANRPITFNSQNQTYDHETPLGRSNSDTPPMTEPTVHENPKEKKLRQSDYNVALALFIMFLVQTLCSFLSTILIPSYLMQYEVGIMQWGRNMEMSYGYIMFIVATALELVILSLHCSRSLTGFCIGGYEEKNIVSSNSFDQQAGLPMLMHSTASDLRRQSLNSFTTTPIKPGLYPYTPNPANDNNYNYNNNYNNNNYNKNYNNNYNNNNNNNNNNNDNVDKGYNEQHIINKNKNVYMEELEMPTKTVSAISPPREGSEVTAQHTAKKDVYVMGEEPSSSEDKRSAKKSTALPPPREASAPRFPLAEDELSAESKEPIGKEDVMGQSAQDIFQVPSTQPLTIIHHPSLPTSKDTEAEGEAK